MSDSVAAASAEPEFQAFLETAFGRMSVDRFIAIAGHDGIAARFAILDGFMAFYSTCKRWTQKMTNALCKAVPKEQTTQVLPEVWNAISCD